MKTVVLDANELSRDFMCWGLKYQLLEHMFHATWLTVYVPAVALEELVANHRRAVEKNEAGIGQLDRQRRRLGLSAVAPTSDSFDYRSYVTERWNQRLAFNVLPWPTVTHEKLVERAVDHLPPFNSKGTGYRDALTWSDVVSLAAEGCDVAFVSADGVFGDPVGNLAELLQEDVERVGGKVELVRDFGAWLLEQLPWQVENLPKAVKISRDAEFYDFYLKSDFQSELAPELSDLGLDQAPYALEIDEIFGPDADELEEGKADQPELGALREAKNALPSLTDEDIADLEWLSDWGHRFEGRPDSRLEALLAYIEGTLRSHSDWNNERLVIFTEYVDTLRWIRDILRQQGYEDDRVEIIDGGTDTETRELIRARFNEDPAKTPVRILLATDAAGEGIDLQHHCHRLMNFDIPFNPNRLEQRIGRVDRYGQTKAPDIRHFAPVLDEGSALSKDLDLLARVAVKIDQIMRDLGSANEIIAPDLQRQLGGEVIQPRRAKAEKDPVAGLMRGEKELNAELARLEENLAASRERLHLRPENLQRVVETAFELNNLPSLELVGSENTDVPVFRLPNLDNSWEQVTRGLYTRLDEKNARPIAFDPQVLSEDPNVVYMHLGSPLLQRATRRLRSALWGGDRALERVTATVVPGLGESYAVAVTRLVLVGAAGLRLHEEVFLAGTRLARRQAVGEQRAEGLLESALDRTDLTTVPPHIADQLATAWNSTGDDGLRARVQQAIGERAARRRKDVEAHLIERREADRERVGEIFDRFGQTLTEALSEAEAMDGDPQLGLFEDERRQSERDLREIRHRIEALGEELDRELAAVVKRYDDIRTWEFPAAVIFAIAPSDLENGLAIR